jgi:FkbM family methyltransferase
MPVVKDPALEVGVHFGRRPTYFVQIGANDGRSGDPLHRLIVQRQWSGILVEPIPHVFNQLLATYHGNPLLSFENVAIADGPEWRPFYYLRETDDDLPSWYRQLGSLDLRVLLSHRGAIPQIERYIESIMVPCLTFDQLLDRHRRPRVDLIHIDAEGWEFNILKSVNVARYMPSAILYEHKHLATADARAAEDLLTSLGYRMTYFPDDSLAVLPFDKENAY